MIYLVSAYAFAILVLGGYLAWSLRQLREMEKRRQSER
jgi:heme exporter protein CcmD